MITGRFVPVWHLFPSLESGPAFWPGPHWYPPGLHQAQSFLSWSKKQGNPLVEKVYLLFGTPGQPNLSDFL